MCPGCPYFLSSKDFSRGSFSWTLKYFNFFFSSVVFNQFQKSCRYQLFLSFFVFLLNWIFTDLSRRLSKFKTERLLHSYENCRNESSFENVIYGKGVPLHKYLLGVLYSWLGSIPSRCFLYCENRFCCRALAVYSSYNDGKRHVTWDSIFLFCFFVCFFLLSLLTELEIKKEKKRSLVMATKVVARGELFSCCWLLPFW